MSGRPKNVPHQLGTSRSGDRPTHRQGLKSGRDPKIAARFVDFGAPPLGGSPAEFGKIIRDDTEKWAKVIRASGAKAQ